MTPYRKIRHGVREGGYRRFAAATPPSTLLDGLVSYWALDETSGTRVDSVGDNDLTDNNTVGYDTGVNGNAAKFVSANNEQLTSTATLASDTDYFVNLWGNVVDVTVGAAPFLSIDDGNSYNQTSNPVIQVTNSAFRAIVGAGYPVPNESVDATISGGAIGLDGQWVMVSVKYTAATKKVGISVNGGAWTESAALVNTPITAGLTTRIGGWGTGVWLNGMVDEVAIWSRVLTEDERAELYAEGAGKFYPFT